MKIENGRKEIVSSYPAHIAIARLFVLPYAVGWKPSSTAAQHVKIENGRKEIMPHCLSHIAIACLFVLPNVAVVHNFRPRETLQFFIWESMKTDPL